MGLTLVAAPFARAVSDAKPIAGGANQKASVEGCTRQTLFDGVWRLRVEDVQSAHRPFSGDPGTPGYAVRVQIRNGSHRTLSLANSGISGNGTGVELVTVDGNTLDLDVGDFRKRYFDRFPRVVPTPPNFITISRAERPRHRTFPSPTNFCFR